MRNCCNYWKKALKSGIENFGEKHPTVATRQSNLAQVYFETGNYDKSIELTKSALKIFTKILPEGHPYIKQTEEHLLMFEMIKLLR